MDKAQPAEPASQRLSDGEIVNSITGLENNIDTLFMVAEQLHARLRPVCNPEADQGKDPEALQSHHTEVGGLIQMQARRVYLATTLFKDLEERINI